MSTTKAKKEFYWSKLSHSPVSDSRTDDIWFFDELTGWLVNSSGYVCKTEDGGNGWVPKFFLNPALPSKPYLRCMGWANRQYGWFGSVTGIADDSLEYPSQYIRTLLHRTVDGGETWTPVLNLPEGSPAGICGFYAVNENVVYGSGTNDPGLPGPAIIKTSDGGDSWELIDMQEHADNLIDIYFFDEDNGFVVGGKNCDSCPPYPPGYQTPRFKVYAQLKPVVLRTSDGGKTWVNTAAETEGFSCGEWGWKIQFLNEEVGFVSLENFVSAAILKTTDGGQSWVRHDVQDADGKIINNDLEGIGFIDENRGWVGGWGYNFNGYMNSYTEDGGVTWRREDNDPCNPNSDPRLRINRYRLFGDPATGGYCSGLQVYKLNYGVNKKAAFADDSAVASGRQEPTRSDTPPRDKKGAFAKASFAAQDFAAQKVALAAKEKGAFAKAGFAKEGFAKEGFARDGLPVGEHDFDISSKQLEDGSLAISYTLPRDSSNVFLGLWNQLAFFVRTLVTDEAQPGGRQTVIWDGKDQQGNDLREGVYICRMSTDGEQGGSAMVKLRAGS